MGEVPGLVSVIVPTRNSARFLNACLESIRDQTYEPIELIVVDNYSVDTTSQIAARFTSHVLVAGPERSAQVNVGVRHARGEYVYKVDSDFVLHAKVVESCMQLARDGFDAVVVHNSPDVSVGWIARVRKFEVDMYKFDLTHSSARFVRREAYESIGGFDEGITAGEDYDFQNRLNAAGYKTGFAIPEAVHLGEPTSLWSHMTKYFAYGIDFVEYANRNRQASRRQLTIFRKVYLRNWRTFVRHPLRGASFIAYTTCKFGFGAAGFALGKFKVAGGRQDQ